MCILVSYNAKIFYNYHQRYILFSFLPSNWLCFTVAATLVGFKIPLPEIYKYTAPLQPLPAALRTPTLTAWSCALLPRFVVAAPRRSQRLACRSSPPFAVPRLSPGEWPSLRPTGHVLCLRRPFSRLCLPRCTIPPALSFLEVVSLRNSVLPCTFWMSSFTFLGSLH